MKSESRRTGALFLQALAIGCCYLALILRPEEASAAAVAALSLCARVIVPSLFPFFVCANLFCALQLTRPLEKALSHICQPLFGVPGSGAAALLLGLTGGYPSGAQAVCALYTAGSIDREQARALLRFCNNCGPAFIFGVVGGAIFHSTLAGLLLYLIHAFSALLCGILLRKRTSPRSAAYSPSVSDSPPPFSDAFTSSVRRAGAASLEVCMFVVIFGVLSGLLISALSPFLPSLALGLLTGLLELSGGASALSALALSQQVKFIAASFFLAFGGLSVHAQTKAVLRAAELETLPVLAPKLLHALLAAALSVPVYAVFQKKLEAAPAFSLEAVSGGLPLAGFLFCFVLCLIFRKLAASNFAADRV